MENSSLLSSIETHVHVYKQKDSKNYSYKDTELFILMFVRSCAENPQESSPCSSYKSPHLNIDSLDSLESSTESLVSSASTRARLSEISSH